MTRDWLVPGLGQGGGDEAILARAARELQLYAARRIAFGESVACDRRWTCLVTMFLAQSGRPSEGGLILHGDPVDMHDLERQGLVCSNGNAGALQLTAEGVRRLRTHFGSQLQDDVAFFTTAAND